MTESRGSLVRRARIGAIISFLAVALLAPASAFAANTASFSAVSPASGSYSTAVTPRLSVTVYDRYGVHGSGAISVTLDGRKVSPACAYIVAGAFNPKKPDYRRFRLTYQVPTSLGLGTHTVVVKIKDRKGRRSTYAWRFNVDDASDPVAFCELLPASGSSGTAARPRISATVTSRWDVKGAAAYAMTLDGVDVAESIAYATSGAYKNFKVSYQVPSTLTVGAHQVALTIKDASGRTTTRSWSFSIVLPDPVYVEMPIEGASCTDCHGTYPRAHPMTACTSCHGPGKPVGGRAYTPADESAHTLSCALDCHGDPWTGPYPHNLSGDCASCHSPAYPAIPQQHPIDASAIRAEHVSDPSFCTTKFCHASSLTAEHYRTGPNRTRLTCGGCHESTKPLVVAAIAGGLTSCDSCHDLRTLVHPDTTTAHAAVGSCVRTGCHATDVAAVHKGDCSKCHAAGTVPTTNCTSCHGTGTPAGPYHLRMAVSHALTEGGCVAYDCHGVGLGMDASLTHGTACTACHGSAAGATKNCTACHTATLLVLHAPEADHHVAPVLFCTTTDCHGSDVAATHYKNGAARCIACHVRGTTPSTLCTNCHAGDELGVHPGASAAHRITGTTCVVSGCHSQIDAALLHRAGGVACATCHAQGRTPTLECATCHIGGVAKIHDDGDEHHLSGTATCVKAGCHTSNVTDAVPNHDRCSACHWRTGAMTSDCRTCHAGSLVDLHAAQNDEHAAAAGTCVTGCHSANTARLHEDGPGCSACHKATGSPTVVCADCHSGTPNELHSWAVAGHVSRFTGGCLLSGCHKADVVVTHTKDGSPRCVACHAPGVDASIKGTTCSNCHVGDMAALHPKSGPAHAVPADSACIGGPCHATNVGVIHAPSASGCSTCHDGVKTLTIACGATGCHVGELDYLHRRGDTGHVAVPGGCVSSKCHVTDVVTIHSNRPVGPSCLACHASGVDAAVKGTTCSKTGCHPGDLTARHTTRAGTDHDAPAGDCVQDGCHGEDTGVDVAALHKRKGCVACHADGKTASRVCADCHSTDITALHVRGSAYHTAASTSCDQGDGGTCHSRDVVALHAGGPKCAACHEDGTDATNRCADCHTGTFWGGIHVLADPTVHTPETGTCVTAECHATGAVAIHASSSPTNGPGCSPCHRTGTLTLSCQECHTTDVAPRHTSAASGHALVPGVCANDSCHGTDAGANIASIHADVEGSCAICHADDDPSKVCADCHEGGPLTYAKHLAKLPAAHQAPAGTCVSDGCHGTTAGGVDVVALHGPSSVWAGCPKCHAPGKDPSTTCDATGCHASTPAAEHDKFLVVDGVNKHAKPTNTCSAVSCHTGATVTDVHGSTNCAPCHGAGASPAADCNTAECHHSGSFPLIHAAGTASHAITPGSCVSTRCHNKATDALHSTGHGPRCTACHTANGGHASTASCVACHANATRPGQLPSPESTPTPHPTATAADTTHTVAATGCSRTDCHSTNLAAIHATPTTNHPQPAKCMACHLGDNVPSKVCGDCHAADFAPPHPVPMPEHATPVATCTKSECHDDANIALIHVKDGVSRCLACHGDDVTPASTCTLAACHGDGAFPPSHPAPEDLHLSTDACTTACHQTGSGVSNVAKLHVGNDAAKHCFHCHVGEGAAVKACASCHTEGTYHVDAATKHAVSGGCTGAHCHQTDVSTIHGRTGCVACHAGSGATTTVCVDCHPSVSITTHVNKHIDCNTCHPKAKAFLHDFYQYMPTINAAADCGAANCHTAPAGSAGAFRSGGFRHTWVRFNGQDTTCLMDCHGYQDSPYWRDAKLNGQWFDKIAPTTTAHAQDSYVGDATIKLTATDTGEYNPGGSGVWHTYYRIDAAGAQEGTTVVIPAPSSGSAGHTLYFYSKDHCGNIEEEKSIWVVVSAP